MYSAQNSSTARIAPTQTPTARRRVPHEMARAALIVGGDVLILPPSAPGCLDAEVSTIPACEDPASFEPLWRYVLSERCPTCKAPPWTSCRRPPGPPGHEVTHAQHRRRQTAGSRHRWRDVGRAPWREDRLPGLSYSTVDFTGAPEGPRVPLAETCARVYTSCGPDGCFRRSAAEVGR